MDDNGINKPPRWVDWFLEWYCQQELIEEIQGDLHEAFNKRCHKVGKSRARWLFVADVVRSIPLMTANRKFLFNSLFASNVILLGYLKSVLRATLKDRLSTSINLISLVIGILTSILIILYINYELSFDNFHPKADRIFRVYSSTLLEGSETTWAKTPALLAQFLQSQIPQIENTVRIVPVDRTIFSAGNQNFKEDGLILADPSFVGMFNFPVIKGQGVLEPNSILITNAIAHKYFGEADPIGNTISIDQRINLTVAGVISEVPFNSHFHFDFIAPITIANTLFQPDFLENSINTTVYSYLELQPKSELPSKEIMERVSEKYSSTKIPGFKNTYNLQPIKSIHLFSDFGGEFEPNGNIQSIRIMITISIIVLIVACINYINLSAARYSKQLRKIGMLKVIGAGRVQLILMFLTESLVLTTIATFLSLILAYLLLPTFNGVVNRPLTFSNIDPSFLLCISLITLLSGAIVAVYPSLLLSGRKPYELFKSQGIADPAFIRKFIITVQFAISIIFLVVTLTMKKQIEYVQNKDLGFNRGALIILPIEKFLNKHLESLKHELLSNSLVTGVTKTSDIPGEMNWVTSIHYEGIANDFKLPKMAFLNTDANFVQTFGASMVKGTNFSTNSNPNPEYIINETASQFFGWDDPIGKELTTIGGGKGIVVGVVKDFNFKSLHHKIEPLFLSNIDGNASFLFIRVNPTRIRQSLTSIQETWNNLFPTYPFEYFFYDNYYHQLYRSEVQFSTITLIMSLLAVILTCLGLYGITSFSVEQRKKEMSLRKIFGASASNILVILSMPVVKVIFIAEVIAIPIAYYLTSRWLNNFFFSTDLSWWIFLVAGMIIIILSLFTVGYQSVKASLVNPIKWIRHE